MKYECLKLEERRIIEEMYAKGAKPGEIAERVGKCQATIYRELERGKTGETDSRFRQGYCHPYSAYERGTNENINKMIRRFLPKGTDFRKVTAAYIQRVETWINNYPREILGFETSGSLFERYVAEAA